MPPPDEGPLLFADRELSRRLERAEGRAGAGFVEARVRLFPGCGATWAEIAGAYTMFDGVDSPITQTFGLGMAGPVTAAELDALERFFRDRGAPVYHEVSPLADPSVLALFHERGYQPFEFTNLLFRPIHRGVRLAAAANETIRVRVAGDADLDVVARTAVRGWSEYGAIAQQLPELMRVLMHRPDTAAFLAERDGTAIATGALILGDGVALLAGACTVPEARQQGAQLALLEARLRHAADHGYDLAMMGAAPGSASQRNAERHGFRIAYTRIKWRLPHP